MYEQNCSERSEKNKMLRTFFNMKKQVVLFSPMPIDRSEQQIRERSFTNLVGLPLTILAVATFLDNEGYEVHVVSGAEKKYFGKLKELIDKGPICVGISCMTGPQITQGVAVADAIRRLNGDIPIIWGGFHPSIFPEQTARSKHVDFVVRGYGERVMLELVKAIESGGPFEQVRGLTFQKGDDVINTADRPVENINDFPPIPYHLVDVPEFLTKELGERTITYISSRGCPNACSFCADVVVYNRRWNVLSADRVIDDLTMLKEKYNCDAVRLVDSNFFVNEKRVKAICKGMIERKLGLRWGRVNGSAEILVNYEEETWTLMKAAGCDSVAVGAESGYQGALERINKKATVDDVKMLSKLGEKYGIRMLYSFMLGVPIDLNNFENQRKEFLKEVAGTLQLIKTLMTKRKGIDRAVLFRYALYPGSSLYEECKDYGWEEPDTLEKWSNNTLFQAKMPWLTKEESDIIDSIIELVKIAFPPITLGIR